MDHLLELLGALLASGYAIYGFAFLLLPMVSLAYVPVLGVVVWTAVAHSRGRRAFPRVREPIRRWMRFALEVSFGLVNPVIYLTVLSRTMPELRYDAARGLEAAAWVLLAGFWGLRLTGAALDTGSRRAQVAVRLVLWAALACVLLHGARDLWALFHLDWDRRTPVVTVGLGLLRLAPLYLVPVVLLWDYLRALPPAVSDDTQSWHGLFVLPGTAARITVVAVAALALISVILAGYRRSDVAVRGLVSVHRDHIRTAASQNDVDPRLLAAIVYVTHRDELSPFRNALERVVIGAWASNLRGQFGLLPPERVQDVGTDENPLLNRALDISVGLAQVKPRTAQTASVLATGLTPDEIAEPVRFAYRDVEPAGHAWKRPADQRRVLACPLPVPAARFVVADVLLDDASNLAMAALILALYQRQWETANPAWSLRERPDILATLYQIGFERSRPHAEPRSGAFGRRVREVSEQAWVHELFPANPTPAVVAP